MCLKNIRTHDRVSLLTVTSIGSKRESGKSESLVSERTSSKTVTSLPETIPNNT